MRLFSYICSFALVVSSAVAAPVPIFDGKTLEGWDCDPKLWRVEDGMITGGSTTAKIKENNFVCTTKNYANFDLKLKIKCSGDPKTGLINSGIQIRSVRVPGGAHMSGYQVDCGAGWFGKLYDEARRNRVIASPVDAPALDKVLDIFGWNEYHIRAEGPRIQTWINGVLALDYTEKDPNIALDGQIGPQVHSGGVCLVQFKDVTIEELPPTPGAPTWESLAKAKAATPPKPAAAPAAEAKTADEERALLKVPEGFEIELIAAEDIANGIGKFVPLAFDQKGALWTTTALEYPVDGNENPAAADALYKTHAKDKVLVYDRDPKSPTGYASKPRVFAEGLAIPLGVLPYKNGCYVLHGHDIVFAEDTDNDGKADKTTLILTGFGVQDSHLFPHQFTRAPGGWLWLAQGLFNNSSVKTKEGKTVPFEMCRMAKLRFDGAQFEATSVGPNNIWGLVLNDQGEAFIQEANDYGYPVMPFHEYTLYPGGADRLAKSYQPPLPNPADFRMGGTGLSGLALADKGSPFSSQYSGFSSQYSVSSLQYSYSQGVARGGADKTAAATLNTEHRILDTDSQVMFVANPITNRIQTIKMHRDGPRWRLEKLADFLTSQDPQFRPVAISTGPDGCLYIVDWYNKIISHNEVARNHPDRDKIRGRIWRVKAKAAKPLEVPDFTKLSGDELIAKLGGESLAQSHLAWQALADRNDPKTRPMLSRIIGDKSMPPARRIQAAWALSENHALSEPVLKLMLEDANRNLRCEALKSLGLEAGVSAAAVELPAQLLADADPEVRAEALRALGRVLASAPLQQRALAALLTHVEEPLAEPVAPGSRGGKIKVREAYDRDFERYLVRMFLEQQPAAVAQFLDSDAAKSLAVEARLLASLALEPKDSAARVAKLLPQLPRTPGKEELLRLAQFPGEPGVGEALRAVLTDKFNAASLETLLAVKTRLDAAKLAPFLSDAATALLTSKSAKERDLGLRLAAGFALRGAEPALVALAQNGAEAPAAIRALGELGGHQTELFAKLLETSSDALIREEALAALAASKADDAPGRLLTLYPKFAPVQRKRALERLSATKPGAAAVVAALESGVIAKTELDASTLDRLLAVLGANHPALSKLVDSLGELFRPVLTLDGSEAAWTQPNLTLDGPCTIETWVRLDAQGRSIGAADGILGVPGQLDLNFFDGKPRVYLGATHGDVVAGKKPATPGYWMHVAFTRDSAGLWKIYVDGDLDATAAKPVPGTIENPRIAWTTAQGGTRGALSEMRVWKVERSAAEIRAAFDRSLPANTPGLLFASTSGDWGKLQAGAKILKTNDFPPVLTADAAAAVDAQFTKFHALAAKPGDVAKGKVTAALCQACHLFKGQGGKVGPDLSGVGSMGVEAILRNILQPNAAMENGYRIYRVELRDGTVTDSFFVSEDKDAVVIRQPGSDDRRLAKKDIVKTQFLRRSLMPEGLLDTMTPEQVTDLFAYLKTLQ